LLLNTEGRRQGMTSMEPEQQTEAAGHLQEQRTKALMEMDAPFDDAKRYLSSYEFEMFRQTLFPAADAYLAGGDYRLDPRMIEYRAWLHIIDGRKQAPARRRQAEAEYRQFIGEINGVISEFKQKLESEKRPSFVYPPMLARYRPGSWCHLELPTLEKVTEWAAPHIEKKVPPDLAGLVTWNVRGEVLTLPSARYELRGIPCVVWEFIVRVLATVQMELAETTITRVFCGYEYQIPVKSQELGHCYLCPASWYRQVGFTTPIGLLAILTKGELEDEGIRVTKKDGTSISFLIHGYASEVTISTKFYQFIMDVSRDKPLAEGLQAAGVIDTLTARLVQQKISALSSPAAAKAPAGEASDDNGEVEARLGSMGFKETEIKKMIGSAQLLPGMSIDDKIKEALKYTQT
jgi:hypothetical protein